jgi:hypothetical protein
MHYCGIKPAFKIEALISSAARGAYCTAAMLPASPKQAGLAAWCASF